jgi:hypothetical protein
MSRLAAILENRAARHGLSLLVGVAVGIVLHYLLFRLSLPVQPFIYVSF